MPGNELTRKVPETIEEALAIMERATRRIAFAEGRKQFRWEEEKERIAKLLRELYSS